MFCYYPLGTQTISNTDIIWELSEMQAVSPLPRSESESTLI